MPTQTQAQFKSLLAQAETMRQAAETAGKWEPEAAKTYQTVLENADRLKVQIELDNRLAEMKAWGGETNAPLSLGVFSRPAAPQEGAIGKVSDDGAPQERMSDRLLAGMGSKAYQHAFEDQFVSAMKGRPMKSGSMKVLQELVDVAGGNWVVPEFNPYLVAKMPAPTGVSADVRVFTTGSDMLSFPKVKYSGASDDTTGSIYTSGLRMTNVAEAPNSDYTEATNPIAAREDIRVYSFGIPVIVTRELIEDSQFSVLEYVSRLVAETVMLYKNNLYVNGTGLNQPQGILYHPNSTVAYSSGGMQVLSGVSSVVTWAGITSGSTGTFDSTKGLLGMDSALPPQYEAGAKFYMSKQTTAAVRALVDVNSRPLWLPETQYPNFTTGAPAQLLGYPVMKDQFIPAVGSNAYAVILGDMSGYYAAERISMTLEILREIRALRGEWVLLARARFGGRLVEDWRVKNMKCASS